VLSPSTAEIDLGDKAAEYLQVPSLQAYMVLSQDEPKVWLFERTGPHFTSGPTVVGAADAVIRIAGLQLELPMAEIYAGVEID
jgi:Uma2 family endonuclease